LFRIEIEQCTRCGGRLKVIASIEEPELIERILAHRREQGGEEAMTVSLGARAPPQGLLFKLHDRSSWPAPFWGEARPEVLQR